MRSQPTSPTVTIVVPTRNSARTLRDCLESIRKQSYSCTLLVVDNGSEDDTLAIGAELADKVLHAGPERSAQRNAGANLASTSIVGFVDSDMILSLNVVQEAVAAIEAGAVSVIVPETTVGEGYWARVSEFERSFYEGNAAIEAPRFFTSEVFKAVGGFDESMTGAEDWDLGLRSKSAGPRARVLARIIHEEGTVQYFTLCRKKAYYAPGLVLFVRKHGTAALIDVSRRPWLRQPRALLSPLGLGLVALKAGQALSMATSIALFRFGYRVGLPRASENYQRTK